MKSPKSNPLSTNASPREKRRGRGRPAKGGSKKKLFLKCFVTDQYKGAVESYCAQKDISVSHLMYQLLIQIVPNPEA